MKYSVEYIPDRKIVNVIFNGRLNFKLTEQYSKEAVKIAHQNNCVKFLFNHCESIPNGTAMNLHLTGDELQQFGFKNSDRIAIIIEKLGKNKDLLKSENSNSNWCIFKYFSKENINEAYEWLGQDH